VNTKDLRTAFRAIAPFVGAAVLAWIVVLVKSRVEWSQWAAAGVLALAAGGLALFTAPSRRWARLGILPSALVFLAAVGVLRNSVGAVNSGAGALAIIPVFHTALYGRSRRDLAIVLGGVGAFYLLPLVLVGPPAYPHSQYRAALVSVSVYSIIGFATQQLVASVRSQANEARSRELMLERLNEVAHVLFDSPNVRADVCAAAKTISDAAVALLYEPRPGSADLVCTATSQPRLELSGLAAAGHSAVGLAFTSGRPTLVSDEVEVTLGNRELWEATGRPSSVLYQPLQHHGQTLGVLIVGWPGEVPRVESRMTVAALLAHEAAAVIARADAMDHLADEAQTDPLTGLPNRRTWDVELRQALADGEPVAVAMFDFDNFKQFNDTFGHPAGDRLLKETAAAWRDQLRTGDLLARLGGEEFGLLLRSCDPETALEVTERLRQRVSLERTCSAGIAVAQPGDAAEPLIARADRALYEAKAAGRDRSQLAAVV
jgi:diguanylate cyclase (GGDEF)-like protein